MAPTPPFCFVWGFFMGGGGGGGGQSGVVVSVLDFGPAGQWFEARRAFLKSPETFRPISGTIIHTVSRKQR